MLLSAICWGGVVLSYVAFGLLVKDSLFPFEDFFKK